MSGSGNGSGRVVLKCRFVCENCGATYDETFLIKESSQNPKDLLRAKMYQRHPKCRVCEVRPKFKHISTDIIERLPPLE